MVSAQGVKSARGMMVVLGAAEREAFLQRDSVAEREGRKGRSERRRGQRKVSRCRASSERFVDESEEGRWFR